jgi:hypothetical protein
VGQVPLPRPQRVLSKSTDSADPLLATHLPQVGLNPLSHTLRISSPSLTSLSPTLKHDYRDNQTSVRLTALHHSCYSAVVVVVVVVVTVVVAVVVEFGSSPHDTPRGDQGTTAGHYRKWWW